MISQAMGTVFSVASALLFLVILARDVIGDVRILSETDALSRLLNRGGFEDRAKALLRKADAGGRPMALVICDLDHFKDINDTFGHASGDRVIRAFAGFLRDTASAGHVAGRIGGEEFAILLPGANLVTARLFAEATRTAFCGLPVEGLPSHLRFTASFGVAERMPRETLSDLLSRADKALYEAKRGGRDCVRLASTPAGTRSSARSP
ncbi:GGDEF domain-containing protein [Pseudaminobacter salicylatoxidans]